MKFFSRFAFLVALCTAVHSRVHSTHIIGGELIYRCLDPGTGYYEFTLKLYRSCRVDAQGAPKSIYFDQEVYVTLYDASETIVRNFVMTLPPTDTLLNNTYNVCLFSPPDVCVEEAIYKSKAFVPFTPGGLTVSYQRCCRNDEILNVVAPLYTGAAWFVTIPDSSVALCNSSPYYNSYPPPIVCMQDTFIYDHSATDPDGDSLVYSLCNAYEFNLDVWGAAPNPSLPPSQFFPVQYFPPYSWQYPLGDTVLFTIDSTTGLLTIIPPQNEGLYVVAVCVSEYRNGNLLSTNKRDFQFYIAPCLKDINPISTFTVETCNNEVVYFKGDQSVCGNYLCTTYPGRFFWDFGIDSISSDTSTQFNPTYTFPVLDTSFQVMLIVNKGYECADTAFLTVPLPKPLLALYYYSCVLDTVKFFDQSFADTIYKYYGTIVDWRWYFGDGASDSVPDPWHIFSNQGDYTVQLIITTDKGCTDTATVLFEVASIPIDAGEDQYTSLNDPVQLYATGADWYVWSPAWYLKDDSIPNPIATINNSTYLSSGNSLGLPWDSINYAVLGGTKSGCALDTVTIRVVQGGVNLPKAFTPNSDGVNDVYYLLHEGISRLILFRIYNRWGEVIFETTDLNTGWDGTYKSVPQELGNYVYYFTAITLDEKIVERSGDVALIR